MANPALQQKKSPESKISSTSKDNSNVTSYIKSFRSNELIIGLCGAIGAGVKSLKEQLCISLKDQGYKVVDIRLSKLISNYYPKLEKELLNLSGYDRYSRFQNLGDELRKNNGNYFLAQVAIEDIKYNRDKLNNINGDNESVDVGVDKIAYILDQIKHPEEIALLKEVYNKNFYVVGLLRNESERKKNLKEEGIDNQNITKLIERDRKDTDKWGQQVEKSIQLSDYFIRNIDTKGNLTYSVERFIKLIHGIGHLTPKVDETGMYYAFSASLRSACLSRQVGASICDKDGNVLSTGCNDVPKAGGGLYQSESETDKRCYNKGGKCYNDSHKKILKDQIMKLLSENGITDSRKVSELIMSQTKAESIIEYSRAVHAEMDAIISFARNTKASTIGMTLYCTTYPCHVCTRHIIAAGIKKVIYIEPYEKSLATSLYDDSIVDASNGDDSKVLFDNFEGVSPRRYASFFISNNPKKRDGKAIFYTINDVTHMDHQHIHGYGDYETKIIADLDSKNL